MTSVYTRKNRWADVARSELFERAVATIKRHGRATNTVPGFSKSICKEIFTTVLRNAKFSDMNRFMESQIEIYNDAIEEIVQEKQQKAQIVANKEVVKNWEALYATTTVGNKRKRVFKIRFVDELNRDNEDTDSESSPQKDGMSMPRQSELGPAQSPAFTPSEKVAFQQRHAAMCALEGLAMLEVSSRKPKKLSSGKRAKMCHGSSE